MTKYQTEYQLHNAVILYIDGWAKVGREWRKVAPGACPGVLWYSDLNGVRVTQGTAGKIKAIQMKERKWLDLFFPEPRRVEGKDYYGLFIEMKLNRRMPKGYLLKSDKISGDAHTQAQWRTILELRERGYWAGFAGGYDEIVGRIDWYFSGTRLVVGEKR